MTPDTGGPYIQIATFCQNALRDQDGLLSVIRVVDTVTVAEVKPTGATRMQPVSLNTTFVLAMKPGRARGPSKILLQLVAPSGAKGATATIEVTFEGEDRGVNAIVPYQARVSEPGIHWLHVTHGDTLLTKVPLRIMYVPAAQGSDKPN